MRNLSIAFALVVGSVAGCAEPLVGEVDESVTETTSALTTGPFTLHNYQTGLCMGVAAGNPNIWTKMITWTCDGSSNQTFSQGAPFPDNYSYIRIVNNVAANRVLADPGTTNNSPVAIDGYYEADWQGFKPIYSGVDLYGHECYQFEAKHITGKVIGVSGGYRSRGGSVVIWDNFKDPYGHPDQYWCIY